MRRVTTLALALVLLGCGSRVGANAESEAASAALAGEPVALLTGVEACYAGGQSPNDGGLLVPDPDFGTRFDGRGPVMWPVGYTGVRLAGGQVAVLSGQGGLVATTGKEYNFSPVPQQAGEAGEVIARVGAVPVCDGYPWDFVDCAAVADGTGDPAERPYCVLPPSYDLAAVKASFEEECEDPSVLESRTCAHIDVDAMRGEEGHLYVRTYGMHRDPEGAEVVCDQIASAHDDLARVPLGYEIVIIEGKNNKRLATCSIDGT
jgi:hypothetical protein